LGDENEIELDRLYGSGDAPVDIDGCRRCITFPGNLM
jgi:hypothetical protein